MALPTDGSLGNRNAPSGDGTTGSGAVAQRGSSVIPRYCICACTFAMSGPGGACKADFRGTGSGGNVDRPPRFDDNPVLCPKVGWLFALFCSSHEVERLGQAFEGNRH